MKNIILFIGIVCSLASCLEVIDLKHDNSEPVLIVEGLITDQVGPHYVKLSKTISFNSSERSIPVDDAVVSISDNLGNEETLTYVGNGLYETTSLLGAVGRTYFLNVQHAGRVYTSQSTMLPISNIDTLFSTYEKASSLLEEGYYVSIGAPISNPNEVNYYRWKVYEGDSLHNGINDVLVADDEHAAGQFEFQFGYPFVLGDSVKVEMYSLNKDAFDYYRGFMEVQLSDGGLFSPPPVNAQSNVSNGALGLFQACSVSFRELVIMK